MLPRSANSWRQAALWGLVAGLLLSGLLERSVPAPSIAISLALLAALAVTHPRLGAPVRLWLALVTLAAALAGLTIGAERLDAIDGSRLAGDGPTDVSGIVTSTPKAFGTARRFELSAPSGKTTVQALFLDPTVGEGDEVRLSGTLREGVLYADRAQPTGAIRGGIGGALDDIRRKAESALERGAPPHASALLRGFVLGQDDRIAEPVRDEFRRSGLAHVLAVSGQNVMLLALLTLPILALLGVPIRSRLVSVAFVIAIYVPVAGAGASIQRAGVMGVAGLVAALGGRPRARWYALGFAALVTLAADPRASSDIGWQLSFAAVAGLLILTRPLIAALSAGNSHAAHGERDAHERDRPFRRAATEGLAMTIAATVATAPLVAHHFGTVSLTTFAANLLALPAIAPAMWLGMLAGALGQIPSAPVEPLSWLGGLFAGFIAWVARAFGGPWAEAAIPEPSLPEALVWTLVLVGGARLLCIARSRRKALHAAPILSRVPVLIAAALSITALVVVLGKSDPPAGEEPELALTVFDVGQGDAILVQPRSGPAMLVDTGPPGAEPGERLEELGFERLDTVAITHDQLDHAGALGDLLSHIPVTRLLASAPPAACEQVTCPKTTIVSQGDVLKLGRTRVEVLWPPADRPAGDDPNATSLVLRVEHRGFRALLTGDAERELAPFHSGPVDVLKVAHHGSADAGLASLLGESSPALALISVGEENTYGHPAPETLDDLANAEVPWLSTEDSGDLRIEVGRDGWSVE